jgi:hypothetical protein
MTGSSTAPPISTWEARELQVRINDPEHTKTLAAHPNASTNIIRITNTAIAKSGKLNGALTTGSKTWITTARIQRSGDIVLHAVDAPTAERLRENRSEWQRCLGQKAEVRVPTFGVILSDIPISSVDLARQEAMAEKLRSENHNLILEQPILHFSWLSKPKENKRTAALVVDFGTKVGANACIAAQKLTWDGLPKNVQRYSRACRLIQCFKCYKYGHTTRTCSYPEACGFCTSEEHTTKGCPKEKRSAEHKCILCQRAHTAWSPKCEIRIQQIERVAEAKREVEQVPWYTEDPVISSGPPQLGSDLDSTVEFPELGRLSQEATPTSRSTRQTQTSQDSLVIQDSQASQDIRTKAKPRNKDTEVPGLTTHSLDAYIKNTKAAKRPRPLQETTGNSQAVIPFNGNEEIEVVTDEDTRPKKKTALRTSVRRHQQKQLETTIHEDEVMANANIDDIASSLSEASQVLSIPSSSTENSHRSGSSKSNGVNTRSKTPKDTTSSLQPKKASQV